ncbi:MAG: outer membrane protein assembly factor BamB [Betaproteobacteria bacterium]|nr:MAG: outer membrane protein assembly factor BamB [Betaproteobacteria bacterium]
MRFWALVLVLALAACSSPSGPQPAPLPELKESERVREVWSARVGSADTFVFEPAFADGAVYSAARDGTVMRLDAASGRSAWRVSAGTPLSAGVGTDGRMVAVANEHGDVIALDAANGERRWSARVSSEVIAPPAVAAGLVLVRSVDNRVFAFDAKGGKRRWLYQRAPSSLIIRAPSGIAVDGETAFVGFAGGKLTAISLANGGVRWEATVALPKGGTELERVADVVGDPVVQGKEVCAATYQGRVGCYETASGRQVWARDISSLTGVSLDARYAFVADDRGTLQAFDRTNGRSVWKQDKLANRQLSLPQPVGEVIAVGDLEGYVHFVARDTGAFVARYATRGGPVRAAPLPLPGGVLVQTQDGALHALAL